MLTIYIYIYIYIYRREKTKVDIHKIIPPPNPLLPISIRVPQETNNNKFHMRLKYIYILYIYNSPLIQYESGAVSRQKELLGIMGDGEQLKFNYRNSYDVT